jgi:hypothetical protein
VTAPPPLGHPRASAILEETGEEDEDDDSQQQQREQAARKGQDLYGYRDSGPGYRDDDNESASSASTVHVAEVSLLENPPLPPEPEREVSSDSASTVQRVVSTRSVHSGPAVSQYEEGYKLLQQTQTQTQTREHVPPKPSVKFMPPPPGGEYVAMQRSVSAQAVSFGESKESEASQTPLRVQSRGRSEGAGLDSSVLSRDEHDEIGRVRAASQQRIAPASEISPYVSMPTAVTAMHPPTPVTAMMNMETT